MTDTESVLCDATLQICCDYRESEMKVNHALPRHRHLSLQRMCRRHSRFTLHAGLITVSDSQTAPRTLKMSLWNLRVCKLPIIPSVFRKKIKVEGRRESFACCDLLMRVALKKPMCCLLTFLKRGRARFSNEGKSTTYWPTVYSRLP